MNRDEGGSSCKTGGSVDCVSELIELGSGVSMEGFMTAQNSTLQKMEKMKRTTAEFAKKDSESSAISPLI